MENDKLVLAELQKIKEVVNSIQENLSDITLSGEDILAINEYEREKKEGKLISGEDLKKELGL